MLSKSYFNWSMIAQSVFALIVSMVQTRRLLVYIRKSQALSIGVKAAGLGVAGFGTFLILIKVNKILKELQNRFY